MKDNRKHTDPYYLFFDFDHTVYVGGRISPATRLSMLAAQEAGHKLILCTGRSRGHLERVPALQTIPWDGAIYGAADLIYEGRLLETNVTPPEDLALWLDYAKRERIDFYLEAQKQFHPYLFSGDEAVDEHFPEDDPVTKITLIGKNIDPAKFPKTAMIPVVHPRYTEAFAPGCDKGNAILHFCEHLQLPLDRCVAFGDSMNDAPMFRVCPTSIAMEWAQPGLSDLATYQAKSKEGVAEGLRWLIGGQAMKTLAFTSQTILQTNRYSEKMSLPDYPRDAGGRFDRDFARKTLLAEEYGFVNTDGVSVATSVRSVKEEDVAGKCRHTEVLFAFTKGEKSASFPIHIFEPYAHPDAPTVLQLNFLPELPNKYCPVEELMDRGIKLVHLCYLDVSLDNGDFESGLAALLCDRTDPFGAGKLALWAEAARYAATYLLENNYASPDALYVAGHSRLGKTALLAAALDERFAGVFCNCSGSCGAAIAREKTGETLEKIHNVFPYWFTLDFGKWAGREEELPFDQHWLMALVSPRRLCVSTAEKDLWADTDAQFLTAEAADVIYREDGVIGLDPAVGLLPQGAETLSGNIAFSKRSGTHYFSRDDWDFYLRAIGK